MNTDALPLRDQDVSTFMSASALGIPKGPLLQERHLDPHARSALITQYSAIARPSVERALGPRHASEISFSHMTIAVVFNSVIKLLIHSI